MSPEVTAAWAEAYLVQGPDMDVDSHVVFASILGITRDEAKILCYQYTYTQPFLKYLQFSSRETAYWSALKTLKSKTRVDALGLFETFHMHMVKKYQECTAILFAKKDTSQL